MRISLLKSERDPAPVTEEFTFETLTELLHTFRETDCDHEAQRIAAEEKGKKPGKCTQRAGPAWSAGISNGARGDKNIVAMDVLVFDLDHLTLEQCAAVMKAIEGLQAITHSTHTHNPEKDDICLRLVLFPSRTLTPSEIKLMRAAVVHKYGLPADPTTKNEERLYFLPSHSINGPKAWMGVEQGALLNVEELLAVAPSPASPPGTALVAPAVPKVRVESVDMATLRKRLGKKQSALMQRVLRGECLAETGGRDDALNKVASIIAFAIPEAPIEAMLEILRESVNAMEPPEEGDWLTLAEDKLNRAYLRWEAAANEKREMQEAAALVFRKDAASTDREGEGQADAEPFRPETLERWAAEQGTDREGLTRRWIIQHSGGYWIWDNGRYATVLRAEDAELSVFRDLSRAPVVLYNTDDKGNQRPRSLKQLALDYGTVARKVQSSLILQSSHYDAREQTFHESVCPLRRLEPTFDKEVHEYLLAFGGNQAERFLDWCALVPNLDQLLCGLYTMGEKNTGKTLFALGMARLWSEGYSKLEDAFKPFNDTLTRNPFCFADERLPASDTIIDDLREFIGTKSRPLSRKFLDTAQLDGCVRVYVAANNDTLLVNAKATVTQKDVDALAQRIFFIDHGRAPTDMLERLRTTKGPDYVDTFRKHDRIAKHVLWLADNRKPKIEGRFGVSGVSPEFHEQLITDIENVSNMLEFITRFVCKEPLRSAKQLILGGGRLLVNTELAADKSRWESFIVSRRTPTAKQASEALRSVSHDGMETIEGLQFYSVRVPLILRWAKRRGIGNVSLLEKRIQGTNEH